MVAAIVNPVDAVRTGALLAIEGTGAFGAASLALFRFTGGPRGRRCARRLARLLARRARGAGGAAPAARRHLKPADEVLSERWLAHICPKMAVS